MIFKRLAGLTEENKERFFDGFKTVLVAVLISVGGTLVTYCNNEFTAKKQIVAESTKNAEDIERKIVNKMNDRYWCALRLAAAYSWRVDEEKRYQDYDDSVKRWNIELINDLSDMRRYFGQDAKKDTVDIIKKFNHIHDQLSEFHNLYLSKKPLPDTKQLLSEVYEMDDTISGFADKRQEQLQTGKIDAGN